MKIDQTGNGPKHPKHLFVNPLNPLVCPVFVLSVYFSCSCNSPFDAGSCLFPRNNQHSGFQDALHACVQQNKEELNACGFSVWDIGTHSIQKGVVSYLASLVCGLPMASTCIQAGWTMGKVRDIYMHYVASGDQFVGCCLYLLPIRKKFAASPPFFVPEHVPKREGWGIKGGGGTSLQAPFFHKNFVLQELPLNHVICSSHMFQNAEVLAQMDCNY